MTESHESTGAVTGVRDFTADAVVGGPCANRPDDWTAPQCTRRPTRNPTACACLIPLIVAVRFEIESPRGNEIFPGRNAIETCDSDARFIGYNQSEKIKNVRTSHRRDIIVMFFWHTRRSHNIQTQDV